MGLCHSVSTICQGSFTKEISIFISSQKAQKRLIVICTQTEQHLYPKRTKKDVFLLVVSILTPLHTLQHTATHCNALQHIATHCNTLKHTASHCTTLQHTATHCNTLQHTSSQRDSKSRKSVLTLRVWPITCCTSALLQCVAVASVLQSVAVR